MQNMSDYYCKIIYSYIHHIQNSSHPVVIFGAGRAGWYILKVLEYYHIKISAFSDNNPDRQNIGYKYSVLPPNEIAAYFPDALIFIGTFLQSTAATIISQLNTLGHANIYHDMDAFLFIYLIEVCRRECNRNELAKSIDILFNNYKDQQIRYGYTSDSNFVSPFVTSVITQKCSLRCRDCAQLIPYYKDPMHFPAESVLDDLKQYAKAFDVVPEISLHGGEPFLHPEIAEICKGAAAISNIVFISFVTNGTLPLSEGKLRVLSACGADVHQSGGYGSLSKRRDELSEVFRKHSIYSDVLYCNSTQMWTRAAPCKKHFRSSSENNELYKRCMSSKICCQIMDGELHRCPLSMHGSHQGLFPKHKDDYINLHDPDMSDEILVSRIRGFLTRTEALTACDYCDPDGGTLVAPAIQLSRN